MGCSRLKQFGISVLVAITVGCGGARTELDMISDGEIDAIRLMLDLPSQVTDADIKKFCDDAKNEFGSFTEASDAEILELQGKTSEFTETVATISHPDMPENLAPSPLSRTFLKGEDGQFGMRIILMEEGQNFRAWGIQLFKSHHD